MTAHVQVPHRVPVQTLLIGRYMEAVVASLRYLLERAAAEHTTHTPSHHAICTLLTIRTVETPADANPPFAKYVRCPYSILCKKKVALDCCASSAMQAKADRDLAPSVMHVSCTIMDGSFMWVWVCVCVWVGGTFAICRANLNWRVEVASSFSFLFSPFRCYFRYILNTASKPNP